ncbi:MAG: hypothetical protein ACJA2M_001847 [Polaribacter sp.]|jgi:hypothetical protein|tara:strand:- start:2420 stop:2629 length:210 start_codon:yes stop_codon:yes gene_type:complete
MKTIKTYKNAANVERDLKILDLERKIALEEIKLLKEDYKEDLKPINWLHSGLKYAGNFLGMIVLKKIFK